MCFSINRKWESELKNKKKPSLFWAVMLTFGPKFLLIFMTIGIYQVSIAFDVKLRYWYFRIQILSTKFSSPENHHTTGTNIFSRIILDFLSGRLEDSGFAYFAMIGFCLCALSQSITLHPMNYTTLKTGQAIRVSVQKLMMDKLMVTTTSSLHTNYGGQLINLVSNDVSRFDMVITMMINFDTPKS